MPVYPLTCRKETIPENSELSNNRFLCWAVSSFFKKVSGGIVTCTVTTPPVWGYLFPDTLFSEDLAFFPPIEKHCACRRKGRQH